jgi:predicted transcriptional regulator of viral defense system
MLPYDRIKDIFAAHNGIMRTSELHNEHLFYKDIQTLIDHGLIEKVRYGYYQWVDKDNPSEAVIVTRLFPDAIMCMDTALFYYGYSDRAPLAWHLAVSKDSGKSRFNIGYPFIKPYYVEPSILELGAVNGEMEGNPIRIYDKERTICDCLRYMGKMDREIFNKAMRSFIADNGKCTPRLSEYAKKLRVMQKVKMIIGVWM